MRLSSISTSPRRLWAKDTFVYSLRVFIALASIMLTCLALGQIASVITIFLGVIACALAETDDSWRGRLRALLVTLACFAVAAFSVKALFPYPWLFVAGVSASAFGLTMLGAISERYRAIASATLILAIYTTIGVEQGGAHVEVWREPALLLAGAGWYGLLSVLWCALFTHQPVQQKLARLFHLLGDYLELKASLFEPVHGADVEGRRLELAQLNGKVVAALNAAKESIFSRVGQGRPGRKTSRYLALYFIAQDVHERGSSSHYPYGDLADAFYHSDVMFRCQRLLSLQGRACKRLAYAILMRQPFELGGDTQQAREDLDASIEQLRHQENPAWQRLLGLLAALSGNLAGLDRRLARASNPDHLDEQQDSSLFDRSPQSLKDAFDRIKLQLTPNAPLFRHALRLSIALAVGYGMVHLIHPKQGYWIMLTTLFVCAPSYSATLTRMGERIGGTVLGLFLGWVMFRLFPGALEQSLLAVVAGVLFFATRTFRYMLATAAMTVLVVLCFNQVGNGYELFVPRLVDTLVGSLIAGIAVLAILPDWQARRLNQIAASAMGAHSRYLRAIMGQYDTGKRDDLGYRLARRDAHNADAALSVAMSNMLSEPGHFRRNADVGLRFLVASHTLLNYLSALGAHRKTLPDASGHELIARATSTVLAALDEIAARLADKTPLVVERPDDEALALALDGSPDDVGDAYRLVQTQLALLVRQLRPLRSLANRLLELARQSDGQGNGQEGEGQPGEAAQDTPPGLGQGQHGLGLHNSYRGPLRPATAT
jgi:YccS/YhfK family integral membrane protein